MRSVASPGWGLSSARSSSSERATSSPEGRPTSGAPKEKPPYLWDIGGREGPLGASKNGVGEPTDGVTQG